MAQHAPIALFVYNRADHLAKTLAALKANVQASESELFIFSDAAKNDAAFAAVAEVRNTIHRITGFKAISIVERTQNWGLAKSIIEGVTQLVNQYGRVIVLEDDLVTSPYFLSYMNDALDRYENEEQVMQISGHMFPVQVRHDKDAFFLPFTTSWGWATWKRAWAEFDADATEYNLLKDDFNLRKQFDLEGTYPYFNMLEAHFEGKVDSWAIRWYLTVFFKRGLTLFPCQSLVSNTGFDGSGTHGMAYNAVVGETFKGTIKKFPQYLEVDEANKILVYRYLHSMNNHSFISRLRLRFRNLCNAYFKKI